MKLKFFVTTFLVLLLAVCGVSYIHFYFFRTERFRLIDRQLEEAAYILNASELSRSEIEDIDEAEYYIGEALGIEASDLLIRIFSKRRGVIYSNYGNKNAEILKPIQPMPAPGFRTEEYEGHSVRLLTLQLPDKRRFLEVGLLLDRHMIHWRLLSYKVYFYIGLMIILLFLSSVLLSHLLLRPLRELAAYLKYLTTRIGEGNDTQMPLPRALTPRAGADSSDEFQQLVLAVRGLTQRVSESLLGLKTWSAQMLHEIRTPLTIATNSLEWGQTQMRKGDGQAQAGGGVQKSDSHLEQPVRDALAEIHRVSLIVGEFLDWAKTENTPREELAVHAVKLAKLAEELVARMMTLDLAVDAAGRSRLNLVTNAQPTLFARPDLVEQVLANLVENSLKYSAGRVTLELHANAVAVRDEGAGLPAEVARRLGQPFNALCPESADGKGPKGTGLGLARVYSICRKYGWKLSFERDGDSTSVAWVTF